VEKKDELKQYMERWGKKLFSSKNDGNFVKIPSKQICKLQKINCKVTGLHTIFKGVKYFRNALSDVQIFLKLFSFPHLQKKIIKKRMIKQKYYFSVSA